MNVHRWRKLEGSDPATYELVQKTHMLQKRLIEKSEEVVDKDLLIHHKEKLYVELKNILARQPGPEVAEQLSTFQQSLVERAKQMEQMEAELTMSHTQASEYKFEISRINKELRDVKKKVAGTVPLCPRDHAPRRAARLHMPLSLLSPLEESLSPGPRPSPAPSPASHLPLRSFTSSASASSMWRSSGARTEQCPRSCSFRRPAPTSTVSPAAASTSTCRQASGATHGASLSRWPSATCFYLTCRRDGPPQYLSRGARALPDRRDSWDTACVRGAE